MYEAKVTFGVLDRTVGVPTDDYRVAYAAPRLLLYGRRNNWLRMKVAMLTSRRREMCFTDFLGV